MSIDALAMAGIDYRESGIKLKEIEIRDIESTPLYLLAEYDPGNKKYMNKHKAIRMLSQEKAQLNAKFQAQNKAIAPAGGYSG
ncbi:Methylenetetrahydrofolate--tRNA-(uracil-5-)-methyltransferase TrmFO [Bienertia sinuspersici]